VKKKKTANVSSSPTLDDSREASISSHVEPTSTLSSRHNLGDQNERNASFHVGDVPPANAGAGIDYSERFVSGVTGSATLPTRGGSLKPKDFNGTLFENLENKMSSFKEEHFGYLDEYDFFLF
jgi:hypothetical protein